MIASVKFNKIPEDRIIDDVERKDLAIETLSLQDDEENKKVQEVQGRLVKLSRMEGRINRNSSQVMSVFTVKTYSPRHSTGPAITTPCGEATYPAKSMP